MKKLSGQQISSFVQRGQTVPTAEIQIIKAAKNKSKNTLLNCLNTIAMFDRQTAMPSKLLVTMKQMEHVGGPWLWTSLVTRRARSDDDDDDDDDDATRCLVQRGL